MNILSTIKKRLGNFLVKYRKIFYALLIPVIWTICIEIISYVDIKLHPDDYVNEAINKCASQYPYIAKRENLTHYYFEGNHHICLEFSKDNVDLSVYCEVYFKGIGECHTMISQSEE